MLKRFVLALLLSVLILPCKSQAPFPTAEEIESFYGTETLVVLENTMFSTYNAFIKKAMEELLGDNSLSFYQC